MQRTSRLPSAAAPVLARLRLCGLLLIGWTAAGAHSCLHAGESDELGSRPTITNPEQVWQMSTRERDLEHRLDVAGRVNFVDPHWRNLWIKSESGHHYMPLANTAPALRSGQQVRLVGRYIPSQGLDAQLVRVEVLEEFMAPQPVPTAGRFNEIQIFDRQVVTTEAYVDEQQLIDAQHLRLHLIVEDRPAVCWVPPDDAAAIPQLQGTFVRIEAVYSGRVDPTGTEGTVELWAARMADVRVIESIASSPRFELPLVPINRVSAAQPGTSVRVGGRLQRREMGEFVVIRDETGEVLVNTLQRERVPIGAQVEAIGRTAGSGSRWIIQSGLFRRVASPAGIPVGAAATGGGTASLRMIEQIRQLSAAEAGHGLLVDVTGLVVWARPETDFVYLQDVSGGVRVLLPKGQKAPELQKALRVEGITRRGVLAPYVEARIVHDLGSMAHPKARIVTVEQAMTGREDGQWVEMRGFIQRTVSEGDWRWIHVTSPDGEFVGLLQSPVNFVANPGSLIRVRGVCEAETDERDRIVGVRLRVPFLHDIATEEDAPEDLFGLPRRSIASLRQLSTLRDMIRVKVAGVVLAHTPGHSVVLQEGDAAVAVLTRESATLEPGDLVEAVGILGRKGARTLLREAVCRRIGPGERPPAVGLGDPAEIAVALDQRLVEVRGTLVDVSRRPGLVRLSLQTGGLFFDASLAHVTGSAPLAGLDVGAVLELTGLYDVVFDDSGWPRSFQVRLGSAGDVAVVHGARFWTVGRLLGISGVLAGCVVLGIVWVSVLRHRVRRQTEEIRQQFERQSGLEAELERAQRFRALGLLAGGIAHDFNNTLTSVMGNTSLAMLDEEVMARVGDSLRDIDASAKRARRLTQQLVTFAKGGEPLLESLETGALVRDIGTMVASAAQIEVLFEPSTDLWPILADRGQISRALENLLLHASMEGVDTCSVAIDAMNEEVVDGTRLPIAPGRYVRLNIVDRGPGIEPENLKGFFDPYAATKSGDDRFSMAIAYTIIKRHGGLIEVDSKVGQGTLFRLWVPAAASPPVGGADSLPENAVPISALRGKRVLVMDDEETIQRVSLRALRHLQCEPQVVPDGAACVRAYVEAMMAGRRFDAVILDLTVPGGMGGRETIAQLRKIDPAVRAIVSSGYSIDPVMANYRQHGFLAVAPKPYSVGALAEALRIVLSAEVVPVR